jgi:hypothetical protein
MLMNTTQPAIDMVKLAQTNELIRHMGNHLFVGVLLAMAPAMAIALVFALRRRR